jgi:dephospho-CoA kinase
MSSPHTKLVCVVGMAGSGKSVLSDYFVEKNFKYIRFGQITFDEMAKQNLPVSEKNERIVREEIRRNHGMEAYAKLNYPKITESLKESNVLIDGLYSWSEYKYLKEKLENDIILIAVYSPPDLRYERLQERKINPKDKDLRNRPLTEDEAQKRDYAEIENLEKGGPIAMADYTILNIKDEKYLLNQIENIYSEIMKLC